MKTLINKRYINIVAGSGAFAIETPIIGLQIYLKYKMATFHIFCFVTSFTWQGQNGLIDFIRSWHISHKSNLIKGD